jgi:hypothetical protein
VPKAMRARRVNRERELKRLGPARAACSAAQQRHARTHGAQSLLRSIRLAQTLDGEWLRRYHLRHISSMATEIMDRLRFTYVFENWYP